MQPLYSAAAGVRYAEVRVPFLLWGKWNPNPVPAFCYWGRGGSSGEGLRYF